jgi:hypothetical protein
VFCASICYLIDSNREENVMNRFGDLFLMDEGFVCFATCFSCFPLLQPREFNHKNTIERIMCKFIYIMENVN